VDFVHFTVQVGGRDATRCFGGERREESLLLLYSNNGGITWSLMKEMQSLDYLEPRWALITGSWLAYWRRHLVTDVSGAAVRLVGAHVSIN